MGLGLQRLDSDSPVFNGSLIRRVMFASGTSLAWYFLAHRLYFRRNTIFSSLPVVFLLSYVLCKGTVMQTMAYRHNIDEISRKHVENLRQYSNEKK